MRILTHMKLKRYLVALKHQHTLFDLKKEQVIYNRDKCRKAEKQKRNKNEDNTFFYRMFNESN
jgi:hypothetical protein